MAYYVSLLCLLFCFLTFIFSHSEAQMVPATFVFGDSLVDVGNNNHLKLSLAKADFPHNGIDFPGKKPTGRFSNGKNAADFIAEKLGLPTSPPYLSLISKSSKNNSFLGGVSFASGGAGILDGTDELFRQSLPFNKQIEYYSTVHDGLVRQLGVAGAQKYFSRSLFAVVMGSNDILDYFRPDSSRRKKYTPQQFIDLMLTTMQSQLERIYNLGARKFLVVGVGAVGCCPSQRNQNKSRECNEETNYWALRFDDGVRSLLQRLKAEHNDMNYSYFDTYNVLLNFIRTPAAYGFTEVKSACCGLGSLNAKVACLPVSKYCPNRRDHVFWDLYHPTEAADRIIADTIFDGPQQYSSPINLRRLAAL